MKQLQRIAIYLVAVTADDFQRPAFAQSASSSTGAQVAASPRNGQHDFDFSIGTWKTHVRRLQHPLTGSSAWIETDGAAINSKIWNARANIEDTVADGPAGHLEGLTLRL